MAELLFAGPKGQKKIELIRPLRIGREPGNDLVLGIPGVSKQHAVVQFRNNAWIVEDRGSTNGTFVNNERVIHCILRDNDCISIGGIDFTFRDGPGGRSLDTDQTTIFTAPESDSAMTVAGAAPATDDLLDSILRDDDTAVPPLNATSMKITDDPSESSANDPKILLRRMEASREIARATEGTLDLRQMLDCVLNALFEIFSGAERAFVLLVDPDTNKVRSAAVRRRGNATSDQITLSRTALRQAMDNHEAILCEDALQDDRYATTDSVLNLGIRSMMIAPLAFRDDVLGAIYVDTRSDRAATFSKLDLDLLSIAASQVAGCVANARMHAQSLRNERLAAVGQTVAGLSHCVKNILQGIKGGAFILDRAFEKEDMKGALHGWDMVKRNNAFMEDLVFDLLTYSKQRKPQCERSDVNELCSDVYDLAAARAETKNVRTAFEPDEALPEAMIDPNGIRRCVLNLAMNAVDACADKGGDVTLATRMLDDGMIAIEVRDTGAGMPDEVKAKLFTVFFSTKGSKGTGLGLPVTKKIIEEHSGRIEVQSAEGKGTTFTIFLPVDGATDTQVTP